MANNFGKGIKVTSGFDLSAKSPLDNRTVVDTINERDAHVTANRVYEGLKVFVISEKKEYLYDGTGWVESGGLTDDQVSQLVTAYAHALSEHASKELIDEEFANVNQKINTLPTKEMVDSKADLTHTHDDKYYTIDDIDKKLSDIATGGLIDLESYAKKAEVESALASKAELGHGHSASDIDGLSEILNEKANKNEVATKEEVQSKADIAHNHELSQVNGLEDILANKADSNNVHDKAFIDGKFNELNTSLNSKSDIGHNHNDIYYTQSEVDERITSAVTDGKVDLSGYAKVEDLATKSDLGHSHTTSDVEGLSEALDSKANKADMSMMATKEELATKADAGHSHDDVYYTQSEVDERIATAVTDGQVDLSGYAKLSDLAIKADLGHGHTMSDIDGLSEAIDKKANKDEVAMKEDLAGKSDIGHSHDISNINELQEALDNKANLNSVYNKTEIDNKIQTIDSAITSKSDIGHNHNDMYYTQAQVDEAIAKVTTDGIVNLQGYATKIELNEGLQTKADLGHGHTPSDIEGLDELFEDSYSKKEVDDAIMLAKTEAMAHADSAITNLVDSAPEAMNTLNELANAINQHQSVYEAYVNTVSEQLSSKSDVGHDHNDNYYTKEQVQELIDTGISGVDLSKLALKSELQEGLNSKSDLGHGHEISEIVNLSEELEAKINKVDAATKQDITNIENSLSGKADAGHVHDIYADKEHDHKVEDITDISDNYYNKNEINATLSTKADSGHNHDTEYYTKNEVDNKIEAGITDANLTQYATVNYVTNELTKKADLAHGHTFSDVEGLQEELDAKANKNDVPTKEDLSGYAPIDHAHDDRYCTPEQVDEKIAAVDHSQYAIKSTVDSQLSTKSDIGHDHNDIYYTQEQVDERIESGISGVDLSNLATKSELRDGLATKAELGHTHDYANAVHNHTTDEVTDLFDKVYKKEEVDSALGEKAGVGHSHSFEEIAGLQEELDKKADQTEVDLKASKEELEKGLATKSDLGHDHNDIYYTQEQVDGKIKAGIDGVDLSGLATKEELESGLATKAEVGHTHDYANSIHEHTTDQITDLWEKAYKKQEIDEVLGQKSGIDHTHGFEEIVGLEEELEKKADVIIVATKEELKNGLVLKSDVGHNHNDLYYTQEVIDEKIQAGIDSVDLTHLATKEELSNGLATKAEINHTHDYADSVHEHVTEDITDLFDKVYTKTEVDTALGEKATVGHVHDDLYSKLDHVHSAEEINGLFNDIYDKNQIDTMLSSKSDLGHGHNVEEIIGLQDELDEKADKATTATTEYVLSEVSRLEQAIGAKADVGHAHDDIYYSKTEVDDRIADSIGGVDLSNLATKDELQNGLAGKSDLGHTHDYADLEHNHVVADIDDLFNNVYNKLSVDTALANKANINHNHDDMYSKLDHIHDLNDLIGLGQQYYTKTEIDNTLAGYSPVGHGHSVSEISGLVEELNLKADVATTATKAELQAGLNGKAELHHNHDDDYSKLGHNHEGLYLTESQIDTKIKDSKDNSMTEIEAQYQAYTNQKIAELVDGAPEAMNTLNELATAINNHQGIYDAYVETISQQLASKSNVGHNHNDIYYTKTEIDETILDKIDGIDLTQYALKTDLDNYSLATHAHDSRYYLKYQVDAKIAGLGIAGYAKLEDLQKWGELYALKEHTHDDLSVTVELSDVAMQNMLKDVYGFYHGEGQADE